MANISYLESDHYFYYDTKIPVTTSALAESLLSYEAIVRRSRGVLNNVLGAKIKDSEIYVTGVEIGSYKESFTFRFIFGKGRAGEKNVEKIRKKLGLTNVDAKKLIGIVVLGAVLYAAYCFLPKEPTPASIHIENSFNNLGKEIGLSKEEILKLFSTSIKNTEDLKRQVSRLAHPNGEEHTGSMHFDRDDSLTIPSDIVSMIPAGYKKEELDEPFRDYDNVDIVIRAVDLDRPDAGWAGIFPEIGDKRLPVVLAEGLNPSAISIGRLIPANITVVFKVGKNGEKHAKRIMLRSLVDEKK